MIAPWFVALALLNADPPKPAERVTTHTVTPAALPTPLLRHRLLIDQTPTGDALPIYLAAMRKYPRFTPEQAKEHLATSELFDKLPTSLTPDEQQQLQRMLKLYEPALKLVDRAVQFAACDWSPFVRGQNVNQMTTDLLEPVQGFRQFALMLTTRCRLAMHLKDHPAAIQDIARLFAVARHMNAGPTIIQNLVANALTSIGSAQVRTLAEVGGPNLLPALLELTPPRAEAAIRFELQNLVQILPTLADLDRKPLTEAECKELIGRAMTQFLTLAGPPEEVAPFDRAAWEMATFPVDAEAARKRLLTLGYTAEKLDGMPPIQLGLVLTVIDLQHAGDRMKLKTLLPAKHPLAAGLGVPPKVPPAVIAPLGVVGMGLQQLAPSADKTREAEQRLHFNLATVTLTEALRAELAAGTAWGPGLLDAPLVAATLAGSPNKLAVTWDAATESFTAPDLYPIQNARHVWKRPER